MKNKYVATLLAFFLGGIGIHKFYLEKYVQGFLYLIFFWTGIPLIISIFEGLVYLLNSKQWFDINYNAEYLMKQEMMKKYYNGAENTNNV